MSRVGESPIFRKRLILLVILGIAKNTKNDSPAVIFDSPAVKK